MSAEQAKKEAKLQIRRVLLEERDPIGVSDEPLAQNEYDRYLGGVYGLLERDASEAEIANHLRLTETVNMGMQGQSEEKLLAVAKSLKRIPLQAGKRESANEERQP